MLYVHIYVLYTVKSINAGTNHFIKLNSWVGGTVILRNVPVSWPPKSYEINVSNH